MAKSTNEKGCFCWTCGKDFHAMGIARHRKAHRERFEDCKITYTGGETWTYKYSDLREQKK